MSGTYICISALNCVKMRSNSERYLPKEQGTLNVICVHSGDRNLLRDQEPIVCLNRGVRNIYLHKRVELCENALD